MVIHLCVQCLLLQWSTRPGSIHSLNTFLSRLYLLCVTHWEYGKQWCANRQIGHDATGSDLGRWVLMAGVFHLVHGDSGRLSGGAVTAGQWRVGSWAPGGEREEVGGVLGNSWLKVPDKSEPKVRVGWMAERVMGLEIRIGDTWFVWFGCGSSKDTDVESYAGDTGRLRHWGRECRLSQVTSDERRDRGGPHQGHGTGDRRKHIREVVPGGFCEWVCACMWGYHCFLFCDGLLSSIQCD